MASVLESVCRRLFHRLGSPYLHIVQPILMGVGLRLAVLLRARLRSVVVIGVTGSAGKSTTKDLVAQILSLRLPGRKSSDSANEIHDVARAIRSVRYRDRFLVVEVGAPRPGAIDRPLALLRPHVGVVTNVGTDHFRAYGSPEGIAAEKRKLIQ